MALMALEMHSDPDLPTKVQRTGARFKIALQKLHSPAIGNVRGAGLMLGLELVTPEGKPAGGLAGQVVKRGLQDGMILLAGSPQGNVIAFSPPFDVSPAEIAFVAEKLQEYLTSLPGSIS
jgi:4-aminobutyrate aminotransferase-like enzyme